MMRASRSGVWVLGVVAIVAGLIAAACTPIAPLTPTDGGTTASAALVVPDPGDDWARIQTRGEIVVGTSADYPPFEYFDESFRFAGFDPALARAIGDELGVNVVFRDIAFDGLGAALALGQVDVAMAAITVTPERARVVDFSDAYFASSEGWLMRAGAAALELDSAEKLAGFRLGVEQGSIYESWVNVNLVETNIVPPRHVNLYPAIDRAIGDLVEDRIDLVVTDLPTARTFAETGTVKVVDEGRFEQQYAVALRRGSDALAAEINTALAALRGRGTITRLVGEYLSLEPDEIQPVLAEPIEPVPGAAAEIEGCLDAMAWVADLSYDDQAMSTPPVVVPAQPFTKQWLIENIGTCTWDESYTLTYAYGNAPGASMGGQPAAIDGTVAPGETYEVAVDLTGPISTGVYHGLWQMRNGEGRLFGESLEVGVQVAGVPTPTPMPTQTPAPGISFSASASTVLQGEPVTLSWSAPEAASVAFYAEGEEPDANVVDQEGSATDYPGDTMTYFLRVTSRDGEETTRELTVTVLPNPDLPQIVQFSIEPSGPVAAGQCVTLSWQISGVADRAALFRDGETIWDDAPFEGSVEDCPESVGVYEYAIGVAGPAGINYDLDTVVVTDSSAAADAEAPPVADQGPPIDNFAVTPANIVVNGCVEIGWRVGGDPASIQITRDDVILLDGAAQVGSGADCLTEAGVYSYRIEARDLAGQLSSRETTVTVSAPAATPVPTTVAGQAFELVDKQLLVTSYRDINGEQVAPLADTRIDARFGKDGALSGFSGCNDYSAGYQAGDDMITISPIVTTLKFCAEPDGVMDQEALYVSLLQNASSYAVDGTTLTLQDGTGAPLVIYVVGE